MSLGHCAVGAVPQTRTAWRSSRRCRARRGAGETKGVSMEENKKHLAALRSLLALPENRACADCRGSAGARPTWASINCGVFICMRCAGIPQGPGRSRQQGAGCFLHKARLTRRPQQPRPWFTAQAASQTPCSSGRCARFQVQRSKLAL